MAGEGTRGGPHARSADARAEDAAEAEGPAPGGGQPGDLERDDATFSLDFDIRLRPEDLQVAAQPEKVAANGVQHVLVEGLANNCGSTSIGAVSSKVAAQLYGPLPQGETAEERWKETNVETIWNHLYTDDKLTRKISYIGSELQLFTEPEDLCAPLWNVLAEELPPELSAVYAPPPIEVLGASHWDDLISDLPHNIDQLNTRTQHTLRAKLSTTLGAVGGDHSLQRRLRLEGAVGLWEMSSQRFYAAELEDETLEAVIEGVTSLVPDVSWACAAVVWHAVEMLPLRQRLLRSGVVPALLLLLRRALTMRRLRRWRGAMISHALGALTLVSVDPEARRDMFAQDPGLEALVDAATQSLDEDLLQPTPPATPPARSDDGDEGEGLVTGELPWEFVQRNSEEEGEEMEEAEMHRKEEEEEEVLPEQMDIPLCEDLLDLSLPIYTKEWRRHQAMDALCSFLIRDTEGRVVFSQAKGCCSLMRLHALGDGYVDAAVTHILSALTRDNRPRGEGLPLGAILITLSGQDCVQALLAKLTADLQTELQRQLAAMQCPAPSPKNRPKTSPPLPPNSPPAPPPESVPGDPVADTEASDASAVDPADPTPQESSAPAVQGAPAPAVDAAPEDQDGVADGLLVEGHRGETFVESGAEAEQRSERGNGLPAAPTEHEPAATGEGGADPGESAMDGNASEQSKSYDALELLAGAVWGVVGAAMRPLMGAVGPDLLELLVKAANDAMELQSAHKQPMELIIHCLAGAFFLTSRDATCAASLMDLHSSEPQTSPVPVLHRMAGPELLSGPESRYTPEGHVRILAVAALTCLATHDDSKPAPLGEAKDVDLSLTGPHREALRRAGTISVFIETAGVPPKDKIWKTQLQQMSSCGIMYLCTIRTRMREAEMELLVGFLGSQVTWDLPSAAYLAAAFWCIARQSSNLSWLLSDRMDRLQRLLVQTVHTFRDELDEAVSSSISREAAKKQRQELREAAQRGELGNWMGGLKNSENMASLGQRSMRSYATGRSRQVRGWAFVNETDCPAIKLAEYAVAVLWIITWKQLTDSAQAAQANEMFKADSTSWWGVKMHAETMSAPLTATQKDSVQLLSELLSLTTCAATVVLKTNVVSVLWSLSHASTRVEDIVVENGMGGELMDIVGDISLSSSVQQAAVGFLLLLSNKKQTLEQLGGVKKLSKVVVDLTIKAVQTPSPGAPSDGSDISMDVDLLEFSVRGLARLAGSKPGRAAIVELGGVAALATAVRADLKATECLMRLAPDQNWEAVYPLRRTANLQKVFGTLTGMTSEEAEAEGVADILRRHPDHELEDGDAGLLALWALLNLSSFPGAQTEIARKSIFTLLKLTYISPNRMKAAVASHILSHIRKNSENVTLFYKAEFQLKSSFLVVASGAPEHDRDLLKVEPLQVNSGELANTRLEALPEVDEEEQAGMHNVKTRQTFLRWAADPILGPDSLPATASSEVDNADSLPLYLKDAQQWSQRKTSARKMSAREHHHSQRRFEDKREDSIYDLGSIRSYRGRFLRSTLFQSLQAHGASMWKHAAAYDGAEPEETQAAWDADEDEADADFVHPSDQAMADESAEAEQRAQKQTVRQLSAGRQRKRRQSAISFRGDMVESSPRAFPSCHSPGSNSSPGSMRPPTSPAAQRLLQSPARSGRPPASPRERSSPSPSPSPSPFRGSGQGSAAHGSRMSANREGSQSPTRNASPRRANRQRPSTAPLSGHPNAVEVPVLSPRDLLAARQAAAVAPSLALLEPPDPQSLSPYARRGHRSASRSSHARRSPSRPGSAVIVPRPPSLASSPGASAQRSPSPMSNRGARASSVSPSPEERKIPHHLGKNWEPKVKMYVQTSDRPGNPPKASRELLTAACPTDTEKRLREATSTLAEDPHIIKDLLRQQSKHSMKNMHAPSRRSLSALPRLSSGDQGDPVDEKEDYQANMAASKIGKDILIVRPDTGYETAHRGTVVPLQERIHGLWDPDLPKSLKRTEEELAVPPEFLPRPITLINAPPRTPEEGDAPASNAVAGVRRRYELPEGSKHLKAVYKFIEHYAAEGNKAPVVIFEHVDGCKMCEDLFGHFLLPNGKLAHYYHADPDDRRGRFVNLAPPPTPAYSLTELLQGTFIGVPEFTKDLRNPGRPFSEFARLTAFPLPPLAPAPSRSTLRVSSTASGPLFPYSWRLGHGRGRRFTGTPVKVDRLDTLVVRLMDDVPRPFRLRKSVWAQREIESNCKAFFDSPAVLVDKAEREWSLIERCATFRLWVDRACAGYQSQADTLRQQVVRHYDAIQQIFTYYSALGDGLALTLSPKEYTRFLNDIGAVDPDAGPYRTKASCLSHYKEVMATGRIPIVVSKTVVKGKGKKKKKKAASETARARSPSPTRTSAAAGALEAAPSVNATETLPMIDNEMSRAEFVQVMVRLAVSWFSMVPNPDPEGDAHFIPSPSVDAGGALGRFVAYVLAPSVPKAALANPNEFRFKRLYTPEVDEVLKGDFTLPAAELLQLVYQRQSVKRQLGTAEVKAMQMTTWLELLDTVGLIGSSSMGLQISLHHARLCFMLAKMHVANNSMNLLECESLTYCEFMEALARVADCISWPDAEVLEAKGFSSLYEYLKADVKTRPRLIKRPSFGILTEPKDKPLASKLQQLLMLTFQVFAELAMFSAPRLLTKLKKECKKKGIKNRKLTTEYVVGSSTRSGFNFSNPPAGKKKPKQQ